AHIKEALDLFVYSANRLNIALLVDRAGHGDVLSQRQSGKRRGERINLRGARAVAVDSRVGLLEADAGRKREGLVLRKQASQKTGDDVHAFVMEAPAQIGFALDVDQTRFSKSCGRSYAHGLAERISVDFEDVKPIHLADASPFHIHQQRTLL